MPGVELFDSVVDLVQESDHIVLAVPATDLTYWMFDGKLLANVKPTAHIINVARGTVLDQTALMNALDEDELAYATLDVTEPEPLPEGHPIYTHPKIQDVQCFGVPDKRFGEELCAAIILRPGAEATEEEIRGFCQGKIAHYKIPRYIRFVESFPTTVTGKVQKFMLRTQTAEELGLVEERTA